MATAIDGGETIAGRPRLPIIDMARGVAIVAMVVYHTAYDLSAERLIPVSVVDSLPWRLFARSVAGTFLLLVGVSLVLATRQGMDWRAYGRRLGLVAGAAALVSIATWWFDPGTFVFFGILHEIAVASVLALPFLLWSPWWLTALAAVAALVAPLFLTNALFNAWPLVWIGLSTEPPASMDYVPVLPWAGVVLAGLLVGRLIAANDRTLAALPVSNPVTDVLATAGRWSLAIYLVHQLLIYGLVAALAFVMPPARETVRGNFMARCVSACTTDAAEAGRCAPMCGCMFDGLYGTPLFNVRSADELTPQQSAAIASLLERCSAAPVPPAP